MSARNTRPHNLRYVIAVRAGALALLLANCAAWSQPALHTVTTESEPVPVRIAASAREDGKQHDPELAPAQAARQARRQYGGRVLNVVLEQGPSGPYYRVKLLDEGRVRVVDIQAR